VRQTAAQCRTMCAVFRRKGSAQLELAGRPLGVFQARTKEGHLLSGQFQSFLKT
jgi:hypothetical protein